MILRLIGTLFASASPTARRRRSRSVVVGMITEQLNVRQMLSATAGIIQDINTQPTRRAFDSPIEYASTVDWTYFTAGNHEIGFGLWRTDGTDQGTTLIRDISPVPYGSGAWDLKAIGDSLYFSTPNGLWKSDGTYAGTAPIDMSQIDTTSGITSRTLVAGDRLYFTVRHAAVSGYHDFLYSIANDELRPTLVASQPMGSFSTSGGISQLAAAGGHVYVLSPGTYRSDLTAIRSDGQVRVTAGIRGTLSTAGDRAVVLLSEYDSYRSQHVNRMFVADGTLSDASEVILPSEFSNGEIAESSITSGGGSVWFVIAVSNSVYLSGAPRMLWKSDGTAVGTLTLGVLGGEGIIDTEYSAGRFYAMLMGYSGQADSLWSSDGTPGGTTLIQNLLNSDRRSPSLIPWQNGVLVRNGVGFHRWVVLFTDGTSAGTRVIVQPGPNERGNADSIHVAGDSIYVGLHIHATDSEDQSPYRFLISDGTPDGLRSIQSATTSSSAIHGLQADRLNGTAYFLDYEPNTRFPYQLWQTDGGADRAKQLIFDDPDSNFRVRNNRPFIIQSESGRTYIVANYTNPGELWTVSPETGEPVLVRTFEGFNFANPLRHAVSGSRMFFVATTRDRGSELWVTDGSSDGTIRLTDLVPGDGSPEFVGIAALDSRRVAFAIRNRDSHTELWITDGTTTGTVLLKTFSATTDSLSPFFMEQVGHRVVFAANDSATGFEPWVTDGTLQGTKRLVDIAPGTASSLTGLSRVAGQALHFVATSAPGVAAWWVTDGTTAGTHWTMPARLTSSYDSLEISKGISNGKLFVVRTSQQQQQELFVSQPGTPTTIDTFDPEVRQRNAADFFTAYGLLFYSVNDQTNGWQLWYTDGVINQILATDADMPIPRGTTFGTPREWATLRGGLLYAGWDQQLGVEPAWVRPDFVHGAPSNLRSFSDATGSFLSWNEIFGADHYEMEIRDLSLPATPTALISNGSIFAFPVSLHGRYLEIRVRGVSHTGAIGEWSTAFQTATSERPVLLPAEHPQPGSGPLIRWGQSGEFTAFEFWVNDLDRGIRVAHADQHPASATGFQLGELPPARYAMWVHGIRIDGTRSNWSAAQTLDILANAPTIRSLSQPDNESRADVQWTAVDDATEYELEIRRTGSVTPPQLVVSNRLNDSRTYFRLESGQYSFRVRARRNGRVFTDWSSDASLLIRAAPRLIAERDRIHWTPVREGTGYEVRMFVAGSDTEILRQSTNQPAFDPPAISGFRVYRVEVRTTYADAAPSNWAAVQFERFGPPVVILSGVGATVDATPTLVWQQQPGATSYEVVIMRHGAKLPIYRVIAGNVTNHRIPGILQNGRYTVWIRSAFAFNGRSIWGNGYDLTVGDPPVVQFQGQTLMWNSIAGATRYELWLNQIDSAGRHLAAVRTEQLYQTSYQNTGLSPGRYRGWVRAIRDEGDSKYTSNWSSVIELMVN